VSDRRALEEEAQLFEVDATFAQDAITLFVVPSIRTDLCEQPIKVFRHSEVPQELGCDSSLPTERAMTVPNVSAESAQFRSLGSLYIQTYCTKVNMIWLSAPCE